MNTPGWFTDILAVVMILIAVFSAFRLAISRLRGRTTDVGADGLHILMGMAMAGMFDSELSPVPGAVWQAVFVASAAWFTGQAIRGQKRGLRVRIWSTHPEIHAIESAAMTYMLLPAAPPPTGHIAAMTMPGMTGTAVTHGRNPALAFIFTLIILGYILWTTDRIAPRSRARLATTARPTLAPRLAHCATIAMSAAMGYMLIMTL